MVTLIKNGTIVNEGLSFEGSLLINGEKIEKIIDVSTFADKNGYEAAINSINADKVVDASGMHIIPGAIDDQVHFREPGNTQKATIASESAAAVLGGVTSFMDMPNNNPPTTTNAALEGKFETAAATSMANYSISNIYFFSRDIIIF